MDKESRLSRDERSWILYDVGNSAFVLIIITAIMPIFFKEFAASELSGALSTARWGFANSAASLVLALLSPILGAMADYRGQKKKFFILFLFIGLVFTLSLPLVGQGQWLLCLTLFVFGRIGWAGANVFYDAFIVDVTSADRLDSVSAKGYGYGYIGSIVPFLIIIGLLLQTGIGDGLPVFATKTGFIIVAVWWLVFSLPAIKNLKQRYAIEPTRTPVSDSFKRLYHTLVDIRKQRDAFVFLAAYFFFIDGVGTIISMSTAYGRDLGFGIATLIAVLLFIQIVAFPFTLLFGRMAGKYSAKKMLMVGIVIYIIATILAFFLPFIELMRYKLICFWVVAFLVSSALGGIQALSRSYFGSLIPAQKSSEFFGFYNVFGKFAAISGPFLMGGVTTITGDSRWGILSIVVLFIIGALLLTKVGKDKV